MQIFNSSLQVLTIHIPLLSGGSTLNCGWAESSVATWFRILQNADTLWSSFAVFSGSASQWTDTHIYLAALYNFLLLKTCQWKSHNARILNLNMNISLQLFWGTWSWVWGHESRTNQKWGFGVWAVILSIIYPPKVSIFSELSKILKKCWSPKRHFQCSSSTLILCTVPQYALGKKQGKGIKRVGQKAKDAYIHRMSNSVQIFLL